jgi:hypothetical protein
VPIVDANYVNLYGSNITERKRAEEEREVLQHLAQAFTASLTLNTLVKILAVHCRRLFKYDSFRFDLYDEQAGVRTPVYGEDTPLDGQEPVDVETADDATMPKAIQAVLTQEKVLVNRKEGRIADDLTVVYRTTFPIDDVHPGSLAGHCRRRLRATIRLNDTLRGIQNWDTWWSITVAPPWRASRRKRSGKN